MCARWNVKIRGFAEWGTEQGVTSLEQVLRSRVFKESVFIGNVIYSPHEYTQESRQDSKSTETATSRGRVTVTIAITVG